MVDRGVEVTCRHDFFAWERPCSGTAGADGIPAMLPSLGRIAEDGSGMKLGLQGLALDHPITIARSTTPVFRNRQSGHGVFRVYGSSASRFFATILQQMPCSRSQSGMVKIFPQLVSCWRATLATGHMAKRSGLRFQTSQFRLFRTRYPRQTQDLHMP